jgi:hypothetical protein
MGATFKRERRNVAEIINAFVGAADGTAIMAGEDAHARSDTILYDPLERSAMFRFILAQSPYLPVPWGIASDHPPSLQLPHLFFTGHDRSPYQQRTASNRSGNHVLLTA